MSEGLRSPSPLRNLLRRALGDPTYPGVPPALGELEKLIDAGNRLAAIATQVGRDLGVAHHAELHANLASALALWDEVVPDA